MCKVEGGAAVCHLIATVVTPRVPCPVAAVLPPPTGCRYWDIEDPVTGCPFPRLFCLEGSCLPSALPAACPGPCNRCTLEEGWELLPAPANHTCHTRTKQGHFVEAGVEAVTVIAVPNCEGNNPCETLDGACHEKGVCKSVGGENYQCYL